MNRNNGVIDVTTVGGRIKKLCIDAGFTQEEVAEMLTQLSRMFHVSADYILNGDSPDNLDPIVNKAIEILKHLKTEKAKQFTLAMLRQIQILEG